jgi:hypothetical protein
MVWFLFWNYFDFILTEKMVVVIAFYRLFEYCFAKIKTGCRIVVTTA